MILIETGRHPHARFLIYAPEVTVAGWFHRLDVMIDNSERFKGRKWDTRRM